MNMLNFFFYWKDESQTLKFHNCSQGSIIRVSNPIGEHGRLLIGETINSFKGEITYDIKIHLHMHQLFKHAHYFIKVV
jgi:hypothetical protein